MKKNIIKAYSILTLFYTIVFIAVVALEFGAWWFLTKADIVDFLYIFVFCNVPLLVLAAKAEEDFEKLNKVVKRNKRA